MLPKDFAAAVKDIKLAILQSRARAALGSLAGLTDKSSLFIFGIAPATAE